MNLHRLEEGGGPILKKGLSSPETINFHSLEEGGGPDPDLFKQQATWFMYFSRRGVWFSSTFNVLEQYHLVPKSRSFIIIWQKLFRLHMKGHCPIPRRPYFFKTVPAPVPSRYHFLLVTFLAVEITPLVWNFQASYQAVVPDFHF